MKVIYHLLFLFLPFCLQAQDSLFKSSVQEVMSLKPVENSMESLLNREVVSASNTAEKLSEAPASIIVLTKKQIRDRGYLNLVEMLKDMPEMDIATMYGGSIFKNYFRGYRIAFGSPYLLMVDGIIFNNLYYNETPSLACIPITSVERIEIVYGPASVMYGANAFMGVINVITNKSNQDKSFDLSGNLASSVNGFNWLDMGIAYQKNKVRFSFSARLENGDVNKLIDNNTAYWLRDEHFMNPKLWGALVNTPYGGKFHSPIQNYGVDMRLQIDKLEIGLIRYRAFNGWGTVYAADKVMADGQWILAENTAFLRYQTNIQNKFFSKTFLRYRDSNAEPTSHDIEGYNITNRGTAPLKIGGNTFINPQESIRIVQFIYYPIRNSSWSLYQDFEWRKNQNFSLFVGLKYELKDLQKAFETYGSEYYFPDSLKNISGFYPPMPPKFFAPPQNRLFWQDRGVYAQMKWKITENDILTAGFRVDNNSAYGTTPTLRLGYTKKMGKFLAKAFYGEAFQEPAPRLLYGNWQGSGADPQLRPERSRTFETTLNYTVQKISADLNYYYVLSYDAINSIPGGAQNIGTRSVSGLTLRLQGNLPTFFKQGEWWLNYSLILSEGEDKYNSKGEFTKVDIIGDLAHHKIQGGFTAELFKNFSLTGLFRYFSERDNVLSNPIRKTPAVFVVDTNITYRNFLVKGISLRLKVDNLFNTTYFMSGISSANSGEKAGTWNNRSFSGSGGFYLSLMPQPKRLTSVVLLLDF